MECLQVENIGNPPQSTDCVQNISSNEDVTLAVAPCQGKELMLTCCIAMTLK